jgi:hypothetical protein
MTMRLRVRERGGSEGRQRRSLHVLRRAVYWLSVVVVTLAAVAALLLLLESRDEPSLQERPALDDVERPTAASTGDANALAAEQPTRPARYVAAVALEEADRVASLATAGPSGWRRSAAGASSRSGWRLVSGYGRCHSVGLRTTWHSLAADECCG